MRVKRQRVIVRSWDKVRTAGISTIAGQRRHYTLVASLLGGRRTRCRSTMLTLSTCRGGCYGRFIACMALVDVSRKQITDDIMSKPLKIRELKSRTDLRANWSPQCWHLYGRSPVSETREADGSACARPCFSPRFEQKEEMKREGISRREDGI